MSNENELEVVEPIEEMASELSEALFPAAQKPEEGEVDTAGEEPKKSDPVEKANEAVKASIAKAAPAASGSASSAQSATPDDPLATPPKSWGKEIATTWGTIPESVRKEIVKRESDIQTGFHQMKGLAEFGEGFRQTLEPLMPLLKANNINPAQHAARLMTMHAQLATGTPAQRVQIFNGLMKEFGLAPEHLGLEGELQPPHIDPQVQSLTNELQHVKSTQQQWLSRQHEQETARVTNEVNDFASKNPLFHEVADHIAQLLQTKACTSLQQAYETAVWANPATRQKMLDEQAAAKARSDAEAKATRIAKARQSTAANIRTAPKGRGPTAPKGSIDDTLNEVANRIFAETT